MTIMRSRFARLGASLPWQEQPHSSEEAREPDDACDRPTGPPNLTRHLHGRDREVAAEGGNQQDDDREYGFPHLWHTTFSPAETTAD
jgi:hypothetical protein